MFLFNDVLVLGRMACFRSVARLAWNFGNGALWIEGSGAVKFGASCIL